jgi:hypothetical protein
VKRSLVRAAFILALLLLVVTICITAGSLLGGRWGGGLGGGFGAVTLLTAGNLFDRLWPASRSGWAK